jgi:photosystem II stability/assembly factor-like uncharacterized protein
MKLQITILLLLLSLTSLNAQWWSEQTSNVTATLTSVSAIDHQNVWICGYNGTVLRTTNGGTNWLNVSGGGIPNTVSLINIWGINANTALTAGYQGTTNTWVWKTTNAGQNWVQVFNQPNGFINAIVMFRTTPANGLMTGDPVGGRWSIWKTTNTGNTWDSTGYYLSQNGTETGYNNSLWIASQEYAGMGYDSSIWFGTNNYRIYHSSNYGVNWVVQSTQPEQNSYAVAFIWYDGLTGGSNLLRTTNYGTNWTAVTSSGTGNFGGFVLYFSPVDNPYANYCWYVRNTNSVYRGWNGSNWTVEYTVTSGTYRHITQARNGTYMWAVRTLGGISKCSCYPLSIKQISSETPLHFNLSQNFPNPFNPTTTIQFSIPVKSKIMLRIFDVMGKEITRLVEGNYNAGSYEVFWDATAYSSGIYYYSLSASGENDFYIETKKMALIK